MAYVAQRVISAHTFRPESSTIALRSESSKALLVGLRINKGTREPGASCTASGNDNFTGILNLVPAGWASMAATIFRVADGSGKVETATGTRRIAVSAANATGEMATDAEPSDAITFAPAAAITIRPLP